MLTLSQLVPAELPPPKRRLSAPKPERVRYRGRAYKKLAPADRSLASERAKLLPLTPKAASAPELQRVGTSSVYRRGDVQRSKPESIVRFIGGRKGYGWRKRAAKRGWIRAETLESALLGAKAIGGIVTECSSRKAVGAPLETSYWFRATRESVSSGENQRETTEAAPREKRKATADDVRKAYAPATLPKPKRMSGLA